MKKWLTVLFAVLLGAFVLAGCTGQGGNPGNTDGESQATVDPAEQKTITIGVCQNTRVEDYDNNGLTRYLESVTGYKIKFDYFATNVNDAKTQLSTRLAGGEKLPDILWRFNIGTSVYTQYGREGYFVDLQNYFYDDPLTETPSEKASIFWTRLRENFTEEEQETAIRRMTDQETGAIYVLPRLETSPVDTMQFQTYINQTWLDKLGLSMPTNTDELYNTLVAFRDRDPNGNGQADEIPLIGIETGLGGKVVEWLINMFMYFDSASHWNVDQNGQLYMAATTDEYRQALIFINKLVKENLLSRASWTQDRTGMSSIVTPAEGQPLQVGVFVGHLTLHVQEYNMALKNYVPLPYWGNVIRTENLYSMDSFITADCEDPEGAFDFLMQCYTKEAAIRMRYGEEGIDWVAADPDTTSYIGTPAEIKILPGHEDAFGGNTTATWNSIGPSIMIDAEGEQVQFTDDDEWAHYKREIFSQLVNHFKAQEAKTVIQSSGTLVYTEDEKNVTEQQRTNCSNFISTKRTAFCTGSEDPNDDVAWEKYKSDLLGYGLETWRTQAQTIYDRQNK